MTLIRRIFAVAIPTTFSVLIAQYACASDKPNIVIFLMDDWGAQDVSFVTNPPVDVKTPHIDELRNAGVHCTTGYITFNICAPSRLGLLTGRYQNRFGLFNGNPVSAVGLKTVAAKKSLPYVLKQNGYHTYMVGKWHLGETPFEGKDKKGNVTAGNGPTEADVGFDKALFFCDGGGTDYFFLSDRPHDGKDRSVLSDIFEGKPGSSVGATIVTKQIPSDTASQYDIEKDYLTYKWTAKVIEYIKETPADAPIFLYAAYNAVHQELNLPDQPNANNPNVKTPPPNRTMVMQMASHADTGISRIIKTLKELHRYDNTLFFFLSDNGGVNKGGPTAAQYTSNNGTLREGKHYMYEGGIRTPFVVSWVNGQIPAKSTYSSSPVISLDIMPTALAAAGIPTTGLSLDGVNILESIKHNQPITRPYNGSLFWSGGSDQVDEMSKVGKGSEGAGAVRDANGNKLILQGDVLELYNLVSDESEKNNLLGSNPVTAPADKKDLLINLFSQFIEWQEQNERVHNEKYVVEMSGKKCRTKHWWSLALPMVTESAKSPLVPDDFLEGSVSLKVGETYTCHARARIPETKSNQMKDASPQPTIEWELIEGNTHVGTIAGNIFTAGTNPGHCIIRAKAKIGDRDYKSYLLIKVGSSNPK